MVGGICLVKNQDKRQKKTFGKESYALYVVVARKKVKNRRRNAQISYKILCF